MAVKLDEYQLRAINKLKNGAILCGGVGSGKSRTSLGYYLFKECDGDIKVLCNSSINTHHSTKNMKHPKDLYIITTAKKRDSLEWEKECALFALSKNPECSISGVIVHVDSWNNIKKYDKVYGAFFIFDEQRVVGNGAWVKAFLKIANRNRWILLSATPGDQWTDYIPVFVANGFYKNATEFKNKHCVYSPYTKYPKIDRYISIKELTAHRNDILINMDDQRTTVRHRINVDVQYDRTMYKTVFADHWDPYDNKPIEESGKYVYLLRKVVNSDTDRISKVDKILEDKHRCIIFYNYTYELDILREYCANNNVKFAEWNGQRHENTPIGDTWLYLVQYTAGCEGWNCITTDTVIFYSQSYSYRMTEQAAGRIDRINTSYHDLYYYHLKSSAPIDLMIYRKLKNKQNFNESSIKFNKQIC